MATYPFVPGIDYGPRKGTLGWNIHMAEGGDGTVLWLARRQGESVARWHERIRGVSASFVVKTNGEAIQMVPWDHAAGNLNPNDRSTDKAFYGRRFLLEVLGTHWSDPNAYTLSMEVCGFRVDGPNLAQLETMVALVRESQKRYPGMVGAFGHADQTDTKGCPGVASTMREFWDRVGHGKFAEDDMPGIALEFTDDDRRGAFRFAKDTPARVVATGESVTIPAGSVRHAHAFVKAPGLGGSGWIVGNDGGQELFVGSSVVPTELEEWPVVPAPPPTDCTAEVKAAVAADRKLARVTWPT